jgi:hypothetical protein
MKENRRKLIKLIPDRKKRNLQIKYACFIGISSFILAILILELIYFESVLFDRFSFYSKNFVSLSSKQVGIFLGFCLVIIGYVGMLTILVINLSHRLIGPLCRIESVIKEAMETGKAPTIKLRKHDELQDTINLLNKFFESNCLKKTNDPPQKNSPDV